VVGSAGVSETSPSAKPYSLPEGHVSVDGAVYAIVDGEWERVGAVGNPDRADEEPFSLPDGHISVDGALYAVVDGEWTRVGPTGTPATNAPNRRAQHVYAVLRFAPPASGSLDSVAQRPGDYITVKKLLPTEAEALREVKRLTALNWDTGCLYFAQIGRLFADGPGVGAE
jgi:hypothetical protein